MRSILFWAMVLVACSLPALGRLVQPDGTQVALGEVSDSSGRTLLFPLRAISGSSWLLLPAGSLVAEVELSLPSGQRTLTFPSVSAPGTRIAFEVPGPLRSLTIRGRLPEHLVILRTLKRPDGVRSAWITRSSTDLRIDLPPWDVASGFTPAVVLTRTVEGPWEALISGVGKTRHFTFRSPVVQWSFSPGAWGFFPARIEIPGKDATLSQLRVTAFAPETDLPADPKSIVAWPREAWRNPQREWLAWSGTSVLVLVTANYRVQDAYLKRLAFYVEKTGYRGRLVTDAEMATLHGWNAHDYSATSLAQFFSQAAAESFALNPAEKELRERLIAAGILVPHGEVSWDAGTGALVGISDQSPPALKNVLFVHEAFHGLYFTSAEFRAGVKTTWDALSEPARQRFRTFLASSDYDPSNEALMINEFQAYVLQRTSAEWVSFFRERVLGKVPSSNESATWLAEYLTAARSLEALVLNLYGLRSGEVSLVTTP